MEITQEQIIEALKTNPNFISGVLPTVQESEVFKNMFNSSVESKYKENIGEEVKRIHSLYDEQLEKAGFTPIVKEGGNKEKSYEMLDRFTATFKELKNKEGQLNANERIKALNTEIDKLKSGGAEGHYKGLYESLKDQAISKEQELKNQIQSIQNETLSYKKGIEISKAFSGLKLNPDLSESVTNLVVRNAEQSLLASSELIDGKLVFLDEKGEKILNKTTYEPMTVKEMLLSMASIKDITLTEQASSGGGADISIQGSIETKSVEGKDAQRRLNLDSSQITSQAQFIEVAESKMLESGITVNDEEWASLVDKAFVEYGIEKLPQSV